MRYVIAAVAVLQQCVAFVMAMEISVKGKPDNQLRPEATILVLGGKQCDETQKVF